MHVDPHQAMREAIDQSLLGAATVQEQQKLREHLAACAPCQEYLNASNRVISGLGGFSFEAGQELQERVMASLALRAQQLAAGKPMPLWLLYLEAILLTTLGCVAAVRFSNLAVAAFHVDPGPLQLGVLALWIVPSVLFCLLFPVVHRLSTVEKG
jgi:hypothetical protein